MSENTHVRELEDGSVKFASDEAHPFATEIGRLVTAVAKLTMRAAELALPVIGPGEIECIFSGRHGMVLLLRRLDTDRVVEIGRFDADVVTREATFGTLVPAPSPDERHEPTFH